jgi:hypothetical protein
VDGAAVEAAVWEYAGGWTAFTDAVPGVYLVAAGLGGLGPHRLGFGTVTDAGPYGFDLAAPLDLSGYQRPAGAELPLR